LLLLDELVANDALTVGIPADGAYRDMHASADLEVEKVVVNLTEYAYAVVKVDVANDVYGRKLAGRNEHLREAVQAPGRGKLNQPLRFGVTTPVADVVPRKDACTTCQALTAKKADAIVPLHPRSISGP
jgi:hypothetical protein